MKEIFVISVGVMGFKLLMVSVIYLGQAQTKYKEVCEWVEIVGGEKTWVCEKFRIVNLKPYDS